MQDFINKIKNEISTLDDLEKVRVEIFGKKGILAQGFAKLKELGEDEKKEFAANLNKQRDELSALIEAKKAELSEQEIDSKMKKEAADITLFNEPVASGALHPVMATMDKIIEYFLALNFSLETGPLIEDDFHNFEALNLPKYHPARDMQDTFYLDDFRLLRTHTSPVQVRTMLNQKPPIRMIAPGTVFRRDMDLTHTPMFHQTEPSAEVDISCIFCHGKGCRVCKQTTWLEVLGCGVVDPNVFKAVGYKNVSGYAFGLGVERFAMLLHRVPDLRSLFEGDLRLLEQFK